MRSTWWRMRFRGEGQSEEVVDELVFSQDFLSIFKAAHRFPCVVANGVSFPFDKISISSTPFLVVHNCFYLVFFFAFNKVRGWFHEIGAVGLSFMIR